MIADNQLFGLNIHRLLLPSEGTVAHDSFAHDVGSDFHRALSAGESFEMGRRNLCGIVKLKVEGSERD